MESFRHFCRTLVACLFTSVLTLQGILLLWVGLNAIIASVVVVRHVFSTANWSILWTYLPIHLAIVGGVALVFLFVAWLVHDAKKSLRELEHQKRELLEREQRTGVMPDVPPRDPWLG